MNSKIKTLIAGATGQIGSSVGTHLREADGHWNPIGLARRPPPQPAFPMIAADLTDPADSLAQLGKLEDVTHIVYAARFNHFGGAPESVDTNVAMLAKGWNRSNRHAPGANFQRSCFSALSRP